MAPPKPLDARRELVRGIEHLAQRHSVHQVFADLMEVSALAISNAVDKTQFADREARYLQAIKRYSGDEPKELARLFSLIVLAMDAEGEPSDVLGQLFHDLELHNKWVGQFFTPDTISRFMAGMTVNNDSMREHIERRGFFTVLEPTIGAGGMIMAVANTMLNAKMNPHRQMHAQGIDLDLKCVHMAYIQCSLWHIPAVIYHGNSLTGETWSTWYTPAHILGLWSHKLNRYHTPIWADLSVADRVMACQQNGLPPVLALGESMPPALAGVQLRTP